jgi:hypothetical protein
MTPQTPISEVLGVRACAAVERALASATVTAHGGPTVAADAAIITESQLRAVSGPKVVREVRDALREAGLALAADPQADADAEADVWTVRSVTDRGPRIEVTLESGRDRVTLPTTETPRVRVGDRVRVVLRRVRA